MYEILSKYPILATVYIVIVTAVAIFLAVKMMRIVGLERIRGYVYKLFDEAEDRFQHGKNEEKFNYVISFAKEKIKVSGIFENLFMYSKIEGRTLTLNLLTEFRAIDDK